MSRNALRVRDCPVCGYEAKHWRTDRSPATGRLRRKDSIYCSVRCKQRAWRFRQRFLEELAADLGKGDVPVGAMQALGWPPDDSRWRPLYKAIFRPDEPRGPN